MIKYKKHEADQVTTDRTISYILDVIQRSKKYGEKSICFVTEVQGQGKLFTNTL